MDNQDKHQENNQHPVLDNNDDPSLDNNDSALDNGPISNNNCQEETSAELTNDNVDLNTRNDDHFATGSIMGWIGIALSVLSFFMIPILFAGAGIILGIIARMREANTLGYTAIAVGIVSLVVRLFITPFW